MIMTDGTARYAHEKGTWIIKLAGDIRHPLGPALNALLDRALGEPGDSRFVIDLAEAENIDSTCLGILARIPNQPTTADGPRPVIITGGGDIAELLLAVCFDRLFDLVDSADAAPSPLVTAPTIAVGREEMLDLLLDSHRRLCAIDARTHAVFRDVVEALENNARGHQGTSLS
jgi:anti-anti-sigma regulatory factor